MSAILLPGYFPITEIAEYNPYSFISYPLFIPMAKEAVLPRLPLSICFYLQSDVIQPPFFFFFSSRILNAIAMVLASVIFCSMISPIISSRVIRLSARFSS